jgi:hypothetical protein
VFYIQRCSIFLKIGFAVKITDVNSDVCKIHSDFRSGIICFISFYTPFGPAVSEEKIFLTLANQKQELPLAAIFVGGMGQNEETL